MTLNKTNIMIAFVLIVLAGALRFYKLGDWAFAHDETATLEEEASMFLGKVASPESQLYRLPRIIPLTYLIHHVGNTLFGRDEFGSRVIIAIFGSLSVLLTFLLLDSIKGRPTAIATALLMTFWPEHLFRSQETRFYIIVSLFTLLSFLFGAMALRRRSLYSAIAASFFVLAAILSHTLMAVMIGILIIGTIIGSIAEKEPIPKKIIAVYLVAGLITIGFYLIYLEPLMRNWNPKAHWGYSSFHSILASINMLGWPIALLAFLGMISMALHRTQQNWYWLFCGLCWGVLTVFFPFIVTYHTEYIFPFTFSVIVIAGYMIGVIYDSLRVKNGFIVAGIWLVFACLLNLPSVVSHYVDGTRYDVRPAVRYIEDNWAPGDHVAVQTAKIFSYYSPEDIPIVGLSATVQIKELTKITINQGRLWIVLLSYRSGIPEDVRSWLYENSVHKLTITKRRFDYIANQVDVFLWKPQY